MTAVAACAFALGCLAVPALAPPSIAAAPAGPCRVCGTQAAGWQAGLLSPAFADAADMVVPASSVVCLPCMHFARGDTWQAHAAARPELGIKLWAQASWRSYSHFFAPGQVEHPGPRRWAALLDAPPAPPWLAVISTEARRNLLWRGLVATDAARCPVLLETEIVWLDADWPAVRAAFEAMRALGYGRDAVLAGQVHQSVALDRGVAACRAADAALAPWRRRRPELMRLAHFVSVGPEKKVAA